MLNWKLNQAYISKNLCENKDKPKMCCKGKCQLMKQLKKVDGESQQNNNSNEEKTKTNTIDLFFAENNYNLNHNFAQGGSAAFFEHTHNQYRFCFKAKNIKPPILVES